MSRSTVLLCCFLALTPCLTSAMTPEQIAKAHEHFEVAGMACMEDNPITEDDIKDLRAHNVPSGENVPCFIACVMKKLGNWIQSLGFWPKPNVKPKVVISAEKVTKAEAEALVGHNMDENGMLSKEKSLEQAKKIFEDPEEIKNIEEYLHSCSHVNSEAVGDGDKGCERAMLSVKCMKENASKFGFDV